MTKKAKSKMDLYKKIIDLFRCFVDIFVKIDFNLIFKKCQL